MVIRGCLLMLKIILGGAFLIGFLMGLIGEAIKKL
nr:MAG TPA: protein of unknown function (DUF883) [Caudoviricetes sp.]